MTTLKTILLMAICVFTGTNYLNGQVADTFLLRFSVSKNDTIFYKRIIRFDDQEKLYHIKDLYESGALEMEATYSAFDKNIKEQWQCNYATNTKQGLYQEWYENGQIRFSGEFDRGRASGRCQWWYKNGQIEADEGRLNGQLHGRVRYWTEEGVLENDFNYDHGENLNRRQVTYPYLPYLPKGYDTDTLKRWPVIIYLHGGSQRGTNLKRLYDSGIPDQLYRGREFPFIIISPLCPLHLRWTTDDWFENLYKDISLKYRIDTTRIYLTGLSLGGNGTWYLAEKYPEIFAAIAPISGFTSENDYIGRNIHRLNDMPIWAIHGQEDLVVAIEETERVVKKLEGKNRNLRFTNEPGAGHGISWNIYPGEELYEWFLKFQK